MTMDDPTTYLTRDPSVPAIVVAPTLLQAQDACREYGCSIQCLQNSHANGIRVVTTAAEAVATAAALPPETPWAVVVPDNQVQMSLYRRFGPQTTLAKALGVVTDGVAWLPEKFNRPPR